MFDHVLIPLDFTAKNRAALAAGATLATRAGTGRITLLHVIEPIEAGGEEDPEVMSFLRRLEARAERELARFRATLEDGEDGEGGVEEGTVIGTVAIYGKRADTIVRWAVENAADVIVMSSRPLDPESPPAWPTVSSRVAWLSPRPVLLVR